MKNLWLLWLIIPALLAGCTDFPSFGSHNQTVQQGPPTPIDPNLPPGQRPAAKPPASAPAAQNKPVQSVPVPSDVAQRMPPSPDQITDGNAEQALRFLQDQLDRDCSSVPGKVNPATAWPK